MLPPGVHAVFAKKLLMGDLVVCKAPLVMAVKLEGAAELVRAVEVATVEVAVDVTKINENVKGEGAVIVTVTSEIDDGWKEIPVFPLNEEALAGIGKI